MISYLQTTDWRLIAVDVAMAILLIVLAKLLVDSVFSDTSKKFRDNFQKALSQNREINYRKYLNKGSSIHFEINTLDRWTLRFIERSYVKKYIPFLNIYIVLTMVVILFITVFSYVLNVIPNIIATITLSSIVASLPLLLLELLGKYMSEKARQDLYTYVSTMRSWAGVKQDIIFIFQKTAESLSGPLAAHTKAMVIQIRGNLDPEVAMEILKIKVSNKHFDTFILNMSETYRNQGDLLKLLEKLEREFYDLEEAFNSRKMKTLFDRNVLMIFMFFTLAITYGMISNNEGARALFFHTPVGQIVFSVCSLFFAIGVYWQFKVTDFKH